MRNNSLATFQNRAPRFFIFCRLAITYKNIFTVAVIERHRLIANVDRIMLESPFEPGT